MKGGMPLMPSEVLLMEKKKASWKRVHRGGEEEDSNKKETLTTREFILGAQRARPEMEDEEEQLQPQAKRVFQVPSLEECLGKENLQRLREEDNAAAGVDASHRRIPIL